MPEQNSSFQNANLHIVDIFIIKKNKRTLGKYKIILSDGSFFFVNNKILIEENLIPLKNLTSKTIDIIKLKYELGVSEKKAYLLISRMEHSSKQLKDKLSIRGFSDKAIEIILDRFVEQDFINDRRFAELWINSRLRKCPEGSILLKSQLLKKGIPKKIADEVLLKILTEEVNIDSVKRAAEKISRKSEMDSNKLRRLLYSRGFKTADINFYFNNYYIEK